MAGLLGQGFDDPRSAANMALAAGLLRGDFAGGLLGANDAYGAARTNALRGQMGQLQLQELQQKMEDAQRQRTYLQNLPAPTNPTMAPLYEAAKVGAIGLPDYLKATLPKPMEYNKIDPKDYTPESLRAAAASGDYSKLVPVRKMEVGPGGQAYNPYDLQPGAVLNDPNKPFMIGQGGQLVPNTPYQSYELGKAKAGSPQVRVENRMGDSLAGQVGPMVKDSRVQAEGAVKMFDAADRIERALDSNKVVAGPGATKVQTVRQLAQMVGGGNDEGIRQTRQVIKSLAQMSVEARKQLQGQGQVTESEAAAVAKADAGDINDLTVGELRDLVTLTKRAAHYTAQGHSEMLKQLQSNQGTAGLVPFYKVQRMDDLLNYKPVLPQIGPGPVAPSATLIDSLVNKYAR